MLRTIMSNDRLKHFKVAFIPVLRERDPEQVNWGPAGMPREITVVGKNPSGGKSVLLTGLPAPEVPGSAIVQKAGETMRQMKFWDAKS